MASLSAFSLTLRLGGMLAAGSLAVAGCASSGPVTAGPSSAATPTSSASASASVPASASAASSAPSPASSQGAAPATSGSTGPAAGASAGTGGGPPPCATQNLRAKLVNGQGATGSLFENIDFTNAGSAACTLYGYPGVSIGTGMPFQQVGAAAIRSAQAPPAQVTLQPGQTANSLLRIVEALNYPAAECSPTAVTYLQVYPPNQLTALFLPTSGTGCASASVQLLTVGVVQAGPVTTS